MGGAIVEAAARGQVDLSLVSVDSTAARAHHAAAGMLVDAEVLTTLEKAVEEEKARAKRADGGRAPNLSARLAGSCRLLSFVLTPGQCADSPRFPPSWPASRSSAP
ncbi:hypothetical protein GCM10010095_81620 [Streptomyces anthocyanicus]|uniref:hypothetical protein n=1 Tax=Streptomyces TaxID=1883 RepID=UPI0016707E5E|nr:MULTISPECIES: hypothetical protein [Streptomyces]GGL84494.1 hypothetical protein GCM10010095_81620 [Streptomyces anthocyanicus]